MNTDMKDDMNDDMKKIKLYSAWEEAFFVARDNRFVMTLHKKDGSTIKAYVANPGRMEEFLVTGHPFFITSGNTGKYNYRIVSTCYQDSFILLDSIKVNAIVERFLLNKRIPEFVDYPNLRREVTVNRSKFDFLLEAPDKKPALLEVKSCSLCHNGVAMFPDAPTERGKRHLEDLELLATGKYDCFSLYLINHKNAQTFMPNGHTDNAYCSTFCNAGHIRFLSYCINMTDPVTLDLSFLNPVHIDFEKAASLCHDKGSYLLVFRNREDFRSIIGSIGEREFKKGYYVYVGSAMQGLEKRIKRHLSKNKKRHWHLDFVSPSHLTIEKTFPIRRLDALEQTLANRLLSISDGNVPDFGSSDSSAPSHLFYFSSPPHRRRQFLDLLLDARHFIL